jgi:hypothetical protein
MKWLISSLIISTIFFSCSNNTEAPYTPEEVLRLYQGYIDSNEFDDAKKFCTPAERKRLDKLARSISNEMMDSTIFTTTFLKVNCQRDNEVVICNCLVQDEYEKYYADYALVKMDGQWLVDAPEEVIIIQPDEVDQMLDNFVNEADDKVMY